MRYFRFCMLFVTVAIVLAPSGTMTKTMAAEGTLKQEVAIIVNPKLKLAEMAKKDLTNIFLGKKTQWPDKTAVVFVMLKSGAVHKQFLKDFVGKTESQFKIFWKKQVFTGKAKMPKAFKSEKEMIAYIAKTKGAIGYVGIKSMAGQDKVKKLSVKKSSLASS